jgi:2'-5' RNA ligase
MEQIRSFVAIELPENIKSSLEELENKLKSACPHGIKWVNPRNIHLTLKFLGNIENAQIFPIGGAIQLSVHEIQPFELNISKLGVFPNINKIEVIWIGLNGDLDKLLLVQKKLESCLVPLGFPAERRAFAAHLTLGRVSEFTNNQDRQLIADCITKTIDYNKAGFKVDSISLMKSQLERTGAIYSRLCLIEIKTSC